MEPNDPPVLVLLGRTGDSILMMPAFREIHRRTGLKPKIIVSTEYADVYEGISYAEPIPQKLHWYGGIPKAKAIAAALSEGYRVPQWWNDPCPIPPQYRGNFPLQCHGHNHGVNLDLWPNFMASMYERCGFTQQEMLRLPLVFDQRSPARETALLNHIWPTSMRKKPLLLFNVTGISSPFGFWPELHPVVFSFGKDFHIVDLGKIKAPRIFDLLGAYDVAAGLITCDTATLHLAQASRVPTIAMTVDGWTGSTVRCNASLQFSYNQTPRRLQEVASVLQTWRDGHSPHLEPIHSDRPEHAPKTGGSTANFRQSTMAGMSGG